MKLFINLALALALTASSGCASLAAVTKAKGRPDAQPPTLAEPPQPAYYFLLPLTVPVDAATLPLQGAVYLILRAMGPFC